MVHQFLKICSLSIGCLCWAAVASPKPSDACDMAHDGTACQSSQLEANEEQETAAVRVELLQAHKHKQVQTDSIMEARDVRRTSKGNDIELSENPVLVQNTSGSDLVSLLSKDHNNNICMLCGKPLQERVDREYVAFRTDCGSVSSPTGPNSSMLSTPVSQFTQVSEAGVVSNGFCQLNFAKSCVDAVANKDYLYWAKSIDLKAPGARENSAWDGRYCRLNGFLQANMVALQHDFGSTQAKADELCKTKYAKYNIDNLTFMDMMSAARYDDKSAPSLEEAELLAAWNCAMGDLGCDMALCAYSFCEKGSGTGLYDECENWHPIHGMPPSSRTP